jgi:hypothetical protein
MNYIQRIHDLLVEAQAVAKSAQKTPSVYTHRDKYVERKVGPGKEKTRLYPRTKDEDAGKFLGPSVAKTMVKRSKFNELPNHNRYSEIDGILKSKRKPEGPIPGVTEAKTTFLSPKTQKAGKQLMRSKGHKAAQKFLHKAASKAGTSLMPKNPTPAQRAGKPGSAPQNKGGKPSDTMRKPSY